MVYMFVSLLLALGAFNSQNNLLFWALGFAFAALIVSGILSRRMLMGLRAVRLNSPAGHAGQIVRVEYRVLNGNRFVPGFALTVRDLALPDPTNPTTRRDRRHSARPLATTSRAGFVRHVSTRGHADCAAEVLALRRGVVGLRFVRVETSFPFGLIRKMIDVDARGEMVVWPRLLRPDPQILGGGLQAGTSPRQPSRRRGDGDEFFSLREYVEGDSPRGIAWRVSAQRMSTGSPDQTGLLVRQTVAPSPSRVWIVLDLCGERDLDERAISFAASLAKMAHERGMMFGLSEPLSGVLVTPGSGRGHLERLFDALARLDPASAVARFAGKGAAHPPKATTADGTMCVIVHGSSSRATSEIGALGSRVTRVSADDPSWVVSDEWDGPERTGVEVRTSVGEARGPAERGADARPVTGGPAA
ncbi:MAG: DUF58 domain-containing protein [Phycisphaeraceae bacterium]|nr:DUF58 domain-containing protein [Phycisphaeraceae bacterium]